MDWGDKDLGIAIDQIRKFRVPELVVFGHTLHQLRIGGNRRSQQDQTLLSSQGVRKGAMIQNRSNATSNNDTDWKKRARQKVTIQELVQNQIIVWF